MFLPAQSNNDILFVICKFVDKEKLETKAFTELLTLI